MYASPAALERAIADRLAARFPANEIALRRNEVAYRRLVARMQEADPGRWVLKGGFGLILRLDPSRTSNDIDVTYVHEAGEHAVALEALERAIVLDLQDFFSFEIVRVGPATPDQARRVTILCRLGAREFARFRADLAVPTADVPADEIDVPQLTGAPQLDAVPRVLVLAWPQQVAEKICAIFEQHGESFSSRARDLADLAMIARQVDDLDGSELVRALRSERASRPLSLPNGLPMKFELPDGQVREWAEGWPRSTRGAPVTLDDAMAIARAFVGPILDGTAGGSRWSAGSQSYGKGG